MAQCPLSKVLSIAPVQRVLVRARVVWSVVQPPIDDGAILVVGDQVEAVGPWQELRLRPHEQRIDLGDVVALPGLINAHCHLDYTDMAGQISPPRSFSDWIKAVLALKAHRSYSDYALSWIKGARMLLTHGVTTVGDIEAVPELLPEVWSATPLRVCSLLEMTGVRSRSVPAQILQQAIDTIRSFPGRWVGLSPHAPYSTSPELLRLAAAAARANGWLTAIHVAESKEEFDMFAAATGAMFEWLKPQREMTACGQGSPVHYLGQQGVLGPNLLAVHVNYLAEGDAEMLGRASTSVVHCPRSHAYFRHRAFPYRELAAAGVNVCLATDSLASVASRAGALPELDLFAEMRLVSKWKAAPSPELLLHMVTLHPAKAMGMAGLLGELSPGAYADLIAVPFGGSAQQAPDAVVDHSGSLNGVMINGRWALPPHA